MRDPRSIAPIQICSGGSSPDRPDRAIDLSIFPVQEYDRAVERDPTPDFAPERSASPVPHAGRPGHLTTLRAEVNGLDQQWRDEASSPYVTSLRARAAALVRR